MLKCLSVSRLISKFRHIRVAQRACRLHRLHLCTSATRTMSEEKQKPKEELLDFDAILLEIGQFGRFQARNYCLILIGIVFSALWLNQFIFNAAAVQYRCVVPQCESSPPEFSTAGWGEWALPADGGRCARLRPLGDACRPDSFEPNQTVPCDAWLYENHNTIVAEFGLACQDWKRTLVGSVHNLGVFFALPLTAFVSDTYGRRMAFILTATVGSVAGALRALAVSYTMYMVMEFLEAVVGAGLYSAGFVLALEMVGLDRRVVGGNIISCVFALGQVVMALTAWALPSWRMLTVVVYAPSIVCLLYFFVMEESVRWLLSKGRKEEAAKIIFRAAEVNKRKLSPETIRLLSSPPSPPAEADAQPGEPAQGRRARPSLLKQVLGSKTLVTRLLICSTWWVTITFIYYGLSINAVSLAGNSYVNYILISLVEIPGYTLSMLMLDRFGRKSSIISAFFVCGTALVSLPFVADDLPWLRVTLTMTGKLAISMAFSSIYIYTSELFPTELRQSLLGACSMVGRIGSLLAPQTPLLQTYWESLPYMMFGVMAATSGLLMVLTPETHRMRLPDTVHQAENIAVAPKVRSASRHQHAEMKAK